MNSFFLSYWINLLYMIFHNFLFSFYYIYSLLVFCFIQFYVCVFHCFITSQTCFLFLISRHLNFILHRRWSSSFVSVSVTPVCFVICLDYIVFVLFVFFLILQLFPFLLNYSTKQNKENKVVCSRSELLYSVCNAFD